MVVHHEKRLVKYKTLHEFVHRLKFEAIGMHLFRVNSLLFLVADTLLVKDDTY